MASVSTGSGVISAADVSWSQRRIVTTGDDKLLKVWRLEDTSEGALSLILESSRLATSPRRPTITLLTPLEAKSPRNPQKFTSRRTD